MASIGNAIIFEAANQFGIDVVDGVDVIGDGLIHQTYKVVSANKEGTLVLQQINTRIFSEPNKLVENYQLIYSHLKSKNVTIPTPIKSAEDRWLWRDHENQFWRAWEYIPHTSKKQLLTTELASKVSLCFAGFTKALADLPIDTIYEVIPRFHDLAFRYGQFNEALKLANPKRKQLADPFIKCIQSNNSLVQFYNAIRENRAFKKRMMHHDCKISNVLIDHQNGNVICPIDLDTTMPGYFFSDLGDMVRSMASTENEHSQNWSNISLDVIRYESILQSYLSGMQGELTTSEASKMHHAGLIMIYMQGMRFITDHLLGDVYYKINYPYQNLDRGKNQFLLFESLKNYLAKKYRYTF
jgi:hypothetical protein